MSQFVSGISITCFAASYAVALALEVARLFFRSGTRRAIMLVFAGAGLVAHTLYLAHRARETAQVPLSSSFDWYLVAAWLLVGAFFYLTYYYPRAAVGLFVLPLVLALVGAAAFLAERAPIAAEPASQVWGLVHGVFLLLGTVTVLVGFVAGVMYLMQAYRLKHHLPPGEAVRLPSLEFLQQLNGRMVLLSALLVAVGFVAGVILKFIGRPSGEPLPWSDPVVWTTALMLGWLSAAAVFNATYVPARQGRKVAYLTIASFVFLAIALGVLVLVDTQHGGKKKRTTAEQSAQPATFTVQLLAGRSR